MQERGRGRGLQVKTRKDRSGLWIMGRIGGVLIRRRASKDDRRLAREEAAAIENEILRAQWHGPKRGSRFFTDAVASYLDAEPRSTGDARRLLRILDALGPGVTLAQVNQEAADRVRRVILKPDASPATVRRGVITPIRAVMNHAHFLKWCDPPAFKAPAEGTGRTAYLLPAEAERLIAGAAPHLQPLILFLLCTGARVAEALDLTWGEVDLVGAHATLWTKASSRRRRRRRVVDLPPRLIDELGALSDRDGAVFKWETKRPTRMRDGQPKRAAAYADRDRQGGGQIKKGFAGAVKRAGIDSAITPHSLRHTYASWHYALHRNPMKLMLDGGWSSLDLVERYAHLLPDGFEDSIRDFRGEHRMDTRGTGTAPKRLIR